MFAHAVWDGVGRVYDYCFDAADGERAVCSDSLIIHSPNTPKHQKNQALTKSQNNDLALYLSQIIEKHSDLAEIMKAWPELQEGIKAANKVLVQSQLKKKTSN